MSKKSSLGLHTKRALQQAAVELRRAPPKPAQTRRINEAHREAVGVVKEKK